MLRIVLDTNTVISALLWGGTPAKIVDAARAGKVALYTSNELLTELQGVLQREKFARNLATRNDSAWQVCSTYAVLCNIVAIQAIPRTSIYPDDDMVLATATAAKAHLLVSGDRKHLLILGQFENIPIVSVAQAVEMIEKVAW